MKYFIGFTVGYWFYPWKIVPRKIAPKENCHPENCSPSNFLVKFFLSLSFIFMRIFVRKKNVFSLNSFFIMNNNLLILYFSIIFFLWVYFDFQAWHIMFIVHTYVTKSAEHRYLASEANCIKVPVTLWVSQNASIQI